MGQLGDAVSGVSGSSEEFDPDGEKSPTRRTAAVQAATHSKHLRQLALLIIGCTAILVVTIVYCTAPLAALHSHNNTAHITQAQAQTQTEETIDTAKLPHVSTARRHMFKLRPPASSALPRLVESHVCRSCFWSRAPGSPLSPMHFGKRFLTFTWGGQWNNHRGSMELALLFARLSNRTLIIPSPESTPLALNLDLWHLSHRHPIWTHEEFSNHTFQPPVTINIESTKDTWYCNKNDFDSEPEQSAWINDEAHKQVMYRPGLFVPRFIASEFGPSSPSWHAEVVHLTTEWGDIRASFSGMPAEWLHESMSWITEAMHYRPEMFLQAEHVLDLLPREFLGVHLRLGDFLGEGNSDGRPALTSDRIFDFFTSTCHLTLGQSRMLYLATNDQTHPRVVEFTKRAAEESITVVTWDDFAHLFAPFAASTLDASKAAHDQSYIGSLEQMILARSSYFIGSPTSTFSEYVTRMQIFGGRSSDDYDRYLDSDLAVIAHFAQLSQDLTDARTTYLNIPIESKEFKPNNFKPIMPFNEKRQEECFAPFREGWIEAN